MIPAANTTMSIREHTGTTENPRAAGVTDDFTGQSL
jgi:hypothetical protein